MERQRWLLLPGERDQAENHIGLFIFPFVWLMIWLMYRRYFHPEDTAVWPWFVAFLSILSLYAIYTDLWLFGWFSTSDDGIRCGGLVTRTRFIPWESVTDICLAIIEVEHRSNKKDVICCCLNGSKPPRRERHEAGFFAMRQRKYFIVKCSDERYTYFLQKTGKSFS